MHPHKLFTRQGHMQLSDVYFFTISVHGFRHLLADDHVKIIIIESWKYLINLRKINIYGYVIMPNHVHIIWKMMENNKKESPVASFVKFTAHECKKYLLSNDIDMLQLFKSDKSDRSFQFWKRDPLAIPLTSDKSFLQKLDYIHANPIRPKWSLAHSAEDYRWSSASFYEFGVDEFGILCNYRD